MLEVYGKRIVISYGDTLDVEFEVSGYALQSDDAIFFAIKKAEGCGAGMVVLEKQITDIDLKHNVIGVLISAAETEALEVGNYIYDLHCRSGDKRITFNFAANLSVKEVAHGFTEYSD